LALARALGQAGATVVLNGRDTAKLAAPPHAAGRRPDRARARLRRLRRRGGGSRAWPRSRQQVGPIDILFNNAGTTQRAPFHEFPQEAWQRILRTNVDSMIIVGQAVSRRMVARQRGRIVNIASVQSELGRPGIAPYAASKGAVKMLTKGMAIDLGPHGITVNGLGPGYFKTELTAALVADDTFSQWLVNRTPSRRWGDVEDLGGAAVFLASDASAFVNGHILYVDGGITASL
jgi:gluconate 5-dehydrogenase